MAWYYYSGGLTRSVVIKPGLSQSVKPHSKVNIEKIVRETQVLINKGILRRTGSPKNDGKQPVRKVIKSEDIKKALEKSEMAKAVAEKGVTTSPRMAPRKPVGSPEMTDGELQTAEDAVANAAKGGDGDDGDKGAENADELSKDDSDDEKGKRKLKKGKSKKG